MTALALIAGAGGLPAAVAASCAQPPLVCSPVGVDPLGVAVDLRFSFERLAPFLRDLSARGVSQVVLAGAVHRPRLDPALVDRETALLIPDFLAALQGGDDAALRWIIALIEDFGLQVVGLAQIAPSLLVGDGVLTPRAPTAVERADAARGRAILSALDPVDVGQGCAVAQGLCLGVEAIYGTDALLQGIAANRPRREPQKGGVFVKRAKLGQDMRADLPTIGPDTIAAVVAAGLTGLCLQAGHVVMLERDAVLAAAAQAGLSLWAEP